ncbi:hypothetical protein AB3X52_17255 [Nocardioides sp. DS6]|uniref:Endonuclease/exonuclease/phosphatase domain-containing protein n=1 Tax=Nocardioides eburneus TaxID=3231482 RepID=A0ABV3T2E4_9ACTN
MRTPRRQPANLGRPLRGAALITALAVSAAVVATRPTDPAGGLVDDTTPAASSSAVVRVVQGNMESPQSVTHFQADVKKLLAQKPDFITYNEVAYRNDGVLAPGSYRLFRTPGKYTGENPVAWDSSKWTALDTGTWMISNSTKKTAKQKVQLGMRYASWATLQDKAGDVVSVVSAHTAPDTPPVNDLLASSVKRLGKLVAQLAPKGPVVVGGDFNVQYNGAKYKQAGFDAAGLTPTWAITGKMLPTGDHRGATIDYLFLHDASQFTVETQRTVEINSDHDLLVADLGLPGANGSSGSSTPVTQARPAFVHETVRNNPRKAPGASVQQLLKAINRAPKGASVHLVTRHLYGPSVRTAIDNAHKRGVYVQLITGDARQTALEKRYARMLGSNVHHKSWAVNRPKAWKQATLPAAGVLASVSAGVPAVRVSLNRALLPKNQRKPMKAWVATGKASYDSLFVRFFKGVGRTV